MIALETNTVPAFKALDLMRFIKLTESLFISYFIMSKKTRE
jgi:hypothetical protein